MQATGSLGSCLSESMVGRAPVLGLASGGSTWAGGFPNPCQYARSQGGLGFQVSFSWSRY